MHQLDDLLAGTDGLDLERTDGPLAHPLDEAACDLEAHVRLEQMAADLAQRVGHIAFREHPATSEPAQYPGQPLGKGRKHKPSKLNGEYRESKWGSYLGLYAGPDPRDAAGAADAAGHLAVGPSRRRRAPGAARRHEAARDVIAANLRRVHPAERAAQWLADREHARQFSRQFAGGLAKTLANLPANELQDLVSQVVRNRVRTFRVAPALGKTLALALADNRQEELLNATVKLAADAVRNNRELIRERVRAETPWWVPPVLEEKMYEKIIAAVERLLHDMVMDPAHPLRAAFDDAIRDFIERLQHSPEVIERAEALKEEWLMGAATDDLSRKLWEGIRQAVTTYAAGGGDGAPSPLDSGLSEFGTALLSNPTLLAEIDDLLIDVTASVVEKYRHEIGDLIAKTVAGWDPQATSRRFELAVGRDLQFVRINGTLVGGLVGLVIYTLWHR